MTDDADDDDGTAWNHRRSLAHLKGMDLVRRTLEEARGAARSQGKDVGRGRTSSAEARPGRGARGAGGRDRARTPGTRRRSARRPRDLAKSRGWSARVAEGSVFGQWATVVGEQIAEHADPDGAARRRADRGGRVDGVGHPAADGAGATAGQDRRGGRRRRRHQLEDRRARGADVAQGQVQRAGPRARATPTAEPFAAAV